MRIFVTGNAGSGKSTLAKKIAHELQLPVYGLDKIVWQEGWKKTPVAEQEKQLAQLVAADKWVIDGVSYIVQEAADMVIFLDMPRRVCFWRAAKRNHKYLFSSRPDLPSNCPEILIIPQLVKIIWRFPKKVRPKILARQNDATFLHITSRADLARFTTRDLPRLRQTAPE